MKGKKSKIRRNLLSFERVNMWNRIGNRDFSYHSVTVKINLTWNIRQWLYLKEEKNIDSRLGNKGEILMSLQSHTQQSTTK